MMDNGSDDENESLSDIDKLKQAFSQRT